MVVAKGYFDNNLVVEIRDLSWDWLAAHVDVTESAEFSIAPSVSNTVLSDRTGVVVAGADIVR